MESGTPQLFTFLTRVLLLQHFNDHGERIGATSAEEYLHKANFLLSMRVDEITILECRRVNGDRVRYHKTTNEFVVVGFDGYLRSYFKPLQFKRAKPGTPRWKTHVYPTNLAYFQGECKK